MPAEHLQVTVDVAAPAEATWAALVDWDRQVEWMPLTRVRATAGGGRGVGAGIEAFTGLGPLGLRDGMVVEEWDPPRRLAVRHTGRAVRGRASVDVLPVGPAASRVVWSEDLMVPPGRAGRLAWRVVGPVMAAVFRRGLRSLAGRLAAGTWPAAGR